MKFLVSLTALMSLFLVTGCSSFKAQRVDSKTSDEKGLKITDNWMSEDTRIAVQNILKQMKNHVGYTRFMHGTQGRPKIFVAEIQNLTSEAYFPINEINDEFLNEISAQGEFILVDAAAREHLLKEITYQNDGMVNPATAKKVGEQLGADAMVFGSVSMRPEKRDGKKIKEYSVNLRLTDISKGIEVLRTRTKVYKYSDKNSGLFD